MTVYRHKSGKSGNSRQARTPNYRCQQNRCDFLGWTWHDSESYSRNRCEEPMCDGRGTNHGWVVSESPDVFIKHDCAEYKARNNAHEGMNLGVNQKIENLNEKFEQTFSEHKTEPANGDKAAKDLADLISRIAGQSVNEEKVREIVDETFDAKGSDILADLQVKVDEALSKVELPTRIELANEFGEVRQLPGTVHKVFPDVLKLAQLGLNIWLTGPAGTGKSTIGYQVADALERQIGSMSLSVTTPVSDIVGYRDANGNYHDTAFRRIYEGGGVFLFDEVDNGNPNTLVKINEALTNGAMEFADKRVTKHPETIIIAAGNTFGTGADAQYVGRMQLDVAFNDRFVFVEVDIDEALESTIALAQGAEEAATWELLHLVRKLRAQANTLRLKVVISPRASMFGARMLAGGFNMEQVTKMAIRKGISDADWAKVTA